MIFFPNKTVELWEPYFTSKIDSYTGEAIKEYKLIETLKIDFQSLNPR
ncbi:MAG: hypothetical protein PHC65_07055 [Methanobacteriaceae archaeon]|nr:hypothetical protein [Methanobacteriaceae archaeon]MDD4594942.1 hypothetical protein [Methanobacteriaceae archaeon]